MIYYNKAYGRGGRVGAVSNILQTGASSVHPDSFAFASPGLLLAAGQGGAPRLVATHTLPPVLSHYEVGPVGFLQWLGAAHPDLLDNIRKKNPALLTQAIALTAAIKSHPSLAPCPGVSGLSGLGALGDWATTLASWGNTAATYAKDAINIYGAYKGITAATANNINNQAAAASNGQQPYAYPTATGSAVSSTAPPASAVTSSGSLFSGGTGVMIIGGVAIIGALAFFGLRKKRR